MEKEERIQRVSIIKDKKQSRIAIPAEFIDELDITPDKHCFKWILLKENNESSLIAILEENERKT